MSNYGLLFVLSEPSAAMEEEYNDWYDREHIPERIGINGFLSAVRFVSTARARRYLALYDLVGIDVLQSPAYRAFAGENFTPWTKRVVPRAKFERREAVQLSPGSAATLIAPRLLVLRFAGLPAAATAVIEDGARVCFSGRHGVAQWRVFAGHGADNAACFVTASGSGDLESLVSPERFSSAANHLELVETFVPY